MLSAISLAKSRTERFMLKPYEKGFIVFAFNCEL